VGTVDLCFFAFSPVMLPWGTNLTDKDSVSVCVCVW